MSSTRVVYSPSTPRLVSRAAQRSDALKAGMIVVFGIVSAHSYPLPTNSTFHSRELSKIAGSMTKEEILKQFSSDFDTKAINGVYVDMSDLCAPRICNGTPRHVWVKDADDGPRDVLDADAGAPFPAFERHIDDPPYVQQVGDVEWSGLENPQMTTSHHFKNFENPTDGVMTVKDSLVLQQGTDLEHARGRTATLGFSQSIEISVEIPKAFGLASTSTFDVSTSKTLSSSTTTSSSVTTEGTMEMIVKPGEAVCAYTKQTSATYDAQYSLDVCLYGKFACNFSPRCGGHHFYFDSFENVRGNGDKFCKQVSGTLKGNVFSSYSEHTFFDKPCSELCVVTSTNNNVDPNGRYFNFDKSCANGAFGVHGSVTTVAQARNGVVIWTGDIVTWTTTNGGSSGNAHGRRNSGAAPGQWQDGDIFYPTKK